MSRELYSRLGLTESATEREIGEAFRRLASECSPESGHSDAASEKRYQYLLEAYQVLSDMDRRASYDIRGDKTGIRRRTGSGSSEVSGIIRARILLNNIFLCGAAVSAVLFVTYICGCSPVPFYIVGCISLCIKIAEYIMRLIQ
ncbi:MAG: J domain-containing protein [Bacteroidaceae bacterium]|nr:J domain-containing protein [Bacteroidaceae bacterium]